MSLVVLEITGLYNMYDYNVKFNKDITFLYGMNGSGKTTILNITESIITGYLFSLFEYEFNKIKLTYTIDKDEANIHHIIICQNKNSMSIEFNDSNFEITNEFVGDRGRITEHERNEIYHMYFDKYSFLRDIRSTFNHAYLPLNRTFRYDNDDSYRFSRIFYGEYNTPSFLAKKIWLCLRSKV